MIRPKDVFQAFTASLFFIGCALMYLLLDLAIWDYRRGNGVLGFVIFGFMIAAISAGAGVLLRAKLRDTP